MRISDWSSDVCSSDLTSIDLGIGGEADEVISRIFPPVLQLLKQIIPHRPRRARDLGNIGLVKQVHLPGKQLLHILLRQTHQFKEYSDRKFRSEEHTSELQSLMRISYAVFCLKK